MEHLSEYEKTKRDLERLRGYIKEFENKFLKKSDNNEYSSELDEGYRAMLEMGGLIPNRHESQQSDEMFESQSYINSKKWYSPKPKGTTPNLDVTDKYKIRNTVYVKEFYEDPELIKAQIAQMKAPSLEESWWKVPEDLTISLQDFANTKHDLERYIGENIIAKIGGIIVVIGLFIAYRLAVSQGLIPVPVRIVVGCGVAVVIFVVAHHLAKQKNILTSFLITAGTILLYHTIYTSYHEHNMMSAPFAVGYCLIVAFINGVAASLYNRHLLIFLSMIGGYVAPYLIYGWAMPDIPFYAYLATISILFIVISYLENWRYVIIAAFLIWQIDIFSFWVSNDMSVYENALLLSVVNGFFSLIFFVGNVAYTLKNPKYFSPFQIMNNAILSASIVWELYGLKYLHVNGGWYIAGFATLLVVYAFILFGIEKWSRITNHFIWWAILLVTWASAKLLETVWQNIFWVVESVLLVWFFIRTRLYVFGACSQILVVLIGIHLAWIWKTVYETSFPYFIFNPAFFATWVVAFGCWQISRMLRYCTPLERVGFFPAVSYQHLLESCIATLCYLAGLFELLFHDVSFFGFSAVRSLWIGNYNMLYLLFFRLIVHRNPQLNYFRFSIGLLMSLAVLSYLLYGLPQTYYLRNLYLEQKCSFMPFAVHYINVLLSFVTLILLMKDIINSPEYRAGYSFVLWVMCGMIVIHATVELENTFVILVAKGWDSHHHVLIEQTRLVGVTVLWCLIAFVFVGIGMKYKIKEIRVIALVLFGLTLLKFLLHDFVRLNVITQILSFLFVGLLLMFVARMYAQLRTWVSEGKIVADKDSQISVLQKEDLIKKWWNEKVKKSNDSQKKI
ncbi:MAG: DUF2339 domain-containing protein [Cytophagales bacterium]|nr:DUF2339 domain-containing protein [Cytophagales bacterium]MDW8383504.1 DUF2339 domain-containing protein [Flammeovirgaceae bacterium]